MYSSGKHKQLTTDKKPWLNVDSHGGRWPHGAQDPQHDLWRPRSEFDRPPNNPVNPILAEYRRNGHQAVWYADLREWPSREMIHHAQRVITRYVNIFGRKP